jgi:hypothetical protein
MVTASDAQVVRIPAAAGAPPEAHGNYRYRKGVDLAVVTLSELPPDAYRAWARFGDRWVVLGDATPDQGGKALLVAQSGELVDRPDALVVTAESGARGAAPGPRVVLAWPRQ